MISLLPLICARLPIIFLEIIITLDLKAPWNVAACAGILFVCWTCLQHAKTNIIVLDSAFGMTIATAAMDTIHLTLLVRPLHVFRRLKKTESAHELPWFERFIWATELYDSPRGVGWHHQVSFPSTT